jgi:hypothetical protein
MHPLGSLQILFQSYMNVGAVIIGDKKGNTLNWWGEWNHPAMNN